MPYKEHKMKLEHIRRYRSVPVNAERAKELRRIRTLEGYGITVAQWEALFESQGRCCAICRRDKFCGGRGWATDHNHVTGAVRGILCGNCNQGLGRFQDRPALLRVAANYVETTG